MNKYRNKITVYNGVKYSSKKEAAFASKLDILKKATGKDRVVHWIRQMAFPLEVNGVTIGKYVLDFHVTYGDGRVEHIDVKGRRSGLPYEMFKMKSRLVKALYGIEIIEK